MTVVITRRLPGRFDGFLKSCMHEIAPGVYVIPFMNKGVRDRLWEVLLSWAQEIPEDGGLILFWSSKNAPAGLAFRVLGWPKKELKEYEGFWLTHGNITRSHNSEELIKLLTDQVLKDEKSKTEPTTQSY